MALPESCRYVAHEECLWTQWCSDKRSVCDLDVYSVQGDKKSRPVWTLPSQPRVVSTILTSCLHLQWFGDDFTNCLSDGAREEVVLQGLRVDELCSISTSKNAQSSFCTCYCHSLNPRCTRDLALVDEETPPLHAHDGSVCRGADETEQANPSSRREWVGLGVLLLAENNAVFVLMATRFGPRTNPWALSAGKRNVVSPDSIQYSSTRDRFLSVGGWLLQQNAPVPRFEHDIVHQRWCLSHVKLTGQRFL